MKKQNLKITLLSTALLVAVLAFSPTADASQTQSGLCCQKKGLTCDHPDFGEFEDSTWKGGSSTCTTSTNNNGGSSGGGPSMSWGNWGSWY